MKEPEGIGGWNPLRYASAQLGKGIIAFCAEWVGEKAIGVLEERVELPGKGRPGLYGQSRVHRLGQPSQTSGGPVHRVRCAHHLVSTMSPDQPPPSVGVWDRPRW